MMTHARVAASFLLIIHLLSEIRVFVRGILSNDKMLAQFRLFCRPQQPGKRKRRFSSDRARIAVCSLSSLRFSSSAPPGQISIRMYATLLPPLDAAITKSGIVRGCVTPKGRHVWKCERSALASFRARKLVATGNENVKWSLSFSAKG